MANETDKKLFEEISRVFDRSAITIRDFAQEITELEPKYGTASSLVKKKKEQLQDLRLLYDKTLAYINYLRELNNNMYWEFWTAELLRHQRETGLPISKMMALAGQDPEPWKRVDEMDELITRIRKSVGETAEDPSAEFQEFINKLRGGAPSPAL